MALQIIVCIKSVIVDAPDGKVIRSSESCELNPFDRPVLELALRLKGEFGGAITALTIGPEAIAFILCEAMAMGIDRGVLVSDPALAGSDTIATSTALANAIKKLGPFDLVLFGTRSADSDTGHIGPQTAVLLDLPLVTSAYSAAYKDGGLRVERRADGFQECFDLSLPAALTIRAGAVQPRDVGLLGIQLAFEEAEIKRWDLADLGLSEDDVGEAGSPTKVLALSRVDRGRKCDFLVGSAEEQVETLIGRLLDSGLII